MKIKYPIGIVLFSFLLVLTPSLFAVGEPDGIGRNTTAQEKRKQQIQNRLTEAKLKVCQAKEKIVKNRAESLSQLAANMQQKFDAIAEKVKAYYTTKVIPGGKTVANYDSLVADIQAKKGAVQTALAVAQSNAASFACTNDNPKGKMTQFRDDMRAVKSALKDYRTSIKNLIVAVHSLSIKPTETEGEND